MSKTTKIVIPIYLVASFFVAIWIDAMERQFRGHEAQGWAVTTIIALLWPFTVPISMMAVLSDSGRWHIHTCNAAPQ